MEIVEITAKESKKYNQFVKAHIFGTEQQLYEWGEFQAKSTVRDKFWAIVLKKKGLILEHIHASALIIRQKLPFGLCWLYCPRGPLADFEDPEKITLLLKKIAEIAKKEKAVFLRFDPPHLKGAPNHLKGYSVRPAHAHYQPESTLIVDLSQPEDEILKQMKPKGRYNIKVAKKHGVEIHLKGKPGHLKGVKTFYKLFKETVARDQFSGHPEKYYLDMVEALGPDQAKVYIAEYKGKPLAAAIVTYFKDTATYFFGASSNENRNVMAPYLLHWQIMQDAKAKGFKHYDFFGIAPLKKDNPNEYDPKHPWAKVTQFKLKFGGKRVNFAPAQEIVYKPFWYIAIRTIKWLKSKTP